MHLPRFSCCEVVLSDSCEDCPDLVIIVEAPDEGISDCMEVKGDACDGTVGA